MKKETIRKLLAASVLACTVSASQAAVVDVWDYTVDMAWTEAIFSKSTDSWSKTTGITKDNNVRLSWGSMYGWDELVLGPGADPRYARSGLLITDPHGTGKINTDSANPKFVNMFVHTNNSIAASFAALTEATLTVSVELKAGGKSVSLAPTDFKIYFWETPNTGKQCEWGLCDDDLFAFVVMPEINKQFTFEGETYEFQYFQTASRTGLDAAIKEFSPSVCAQISGGALNDACYGFQTKERAQSAVQFSFSIVAVPEPETYAMLLAGLGMVGIIVRRRRNAIRT